ncbi:MAG: GNAT family N-acetyltransferase [Chloroflexi bacterium]|nr:GNAT family N-acetyltransferase [Chloroflexota bacterium]
MLPIEIVLSKDTAILVPILHEAEEDDARILRAIEDPSNTAYLAQSEDNLVGAIVMQWAPAKSEILYIATQPAWRGRGYGKTIMNWIIDEAQRQGTAEIWVGTANAALDNIAFYQKCGFRMDSIRKDFFDYFSDPVYENGIRIQDMVMLKLVVAEVIENTTHS